MLKFYSSRGAQLKKINKLLDGIKHLNHLRQYSAYLNNIQSLVQNEIRLKLAINPESISVVGYKNGQLELAVSSSAAATQLRFQEQGLVFHLSNYEEFAHLKTVSFKVTSNPQSYKGYNSGASYASGYMVGGETAVGLSVEGKYRQIKSNQHSDDSTLFWDGAYNQGDNHQPKASEPGISEDPLIRFEQLMNRVEKQR